MIRGLQQRRLFSALLAVFCAFLTLFAHVQYGNPQFEYMGLAYAPLSTFDYAGLALFSALPAWFLPRTMKRASWAICWIIFFFCYTPAITLLFASGILSFENKIGFATSYLLGMILIVILPQIPVKKVTAPVVSPRAFYFLLLVTFAIFISWIIAQNYSTMRIAGIDSVYDQRSLGAQSVGLSAYAMGMVSGAVNPMLMADGLFRRHFGLLALGLIGQFIVYSVMAHKFVLLSVIYLPVFYLIFRGSKDHAKRNDDPMLGMIGVSYGAVIFFALAMRAVFLIHPIDALNQVAALLLMRLILLPGVMAPHYADFFETNPLTYMAHVGPARRLFDSPYVEEVSLYVGRYLANADTGMNANVNFFAYDGTASFGMAGPAVAGFLVALTLVLFNMFSRNHSTRMIALASTTFAFALSHGSLFATLVTGGGFLLLALVLFNPKAT